MDRERLATALERLDAARTALAQMNTGKGREELALRRQAQHIAQWLREIADDIYPEKEAP